MKIQIDEYDYYKNKKNGFVPLYKELNLSWMEYVKLGDKIVNGWFNNNKSSYLLKLNAPRKIKRFESFNCEKMDDFLLSIGGISEEPLIKKEVKIAPHYDEVKAKDEPFIAADLRHHYRIEEILKGMPDYFGVIWNDKIEKKPEVRRLKRRIIIKKKDVI